MSSSSGTSSTRRRWRNLLALGFLSLTLGACPSNVIYPDGFFNDAADSGGTLTREPVVTKISIDGAKALVEDFKTIKPGESLSFKGEIDCPPNATCNTSWDFGKGETKTGLDGGKHTFPEGYYHIRLTVTNVRDEKLGEAHVYVAAWKGIFKDDFNRKSLDYNAHGWVRPVDRAIEYVTKDNWLYIRHDTTAPGSTGLVAMPLMKNSHVEVTIRRYPHPSERHYMDVLFRVNPHQRETSFYRVRLDQSSAKTGNHLRIAVFKIFDEDQHGMLLSDKTQSVADWDKLPNCKIRTDCNSYTRSCILNKCVPTGCAGCQKIMNFDPQRKQNFRALIDFRDEGGLPTWDVKLVDPQNPSKVLLEQKHIQDTTPNPHLNAGMVGVAQYDLETYYDDFYAERKD